MAHDLRRQEREWYMSTVIDQRTRLHLHFVSGDVTISSLGLAQMHPKVRIFSLSPSYQFLAAYMEY
jgi:hypothetical protein